jgi:redox-sensitive bicupin YhaK (pirin superfamily)
MSFPAALKAGSEWSVETDPAQNLFIYIVQGAGFFEPDGREAFAEKHAVLFDSGKWFWAKAAEGGLRFLLLAGKPLK